MKNAVINSSISFIKKYRNYSENELAIIKYGLEGIYLTITKTIVIFTLAYFLGYLVESAIFLISCGLLRMSSFGLHAKKSWMCLISSVIIFNIIPVIAKNIFLNISIKILIGFIGIILIYKNSPADTYKRPIVSKKRRKKLKIISTIISVIYFILSLFVNNQFICNCFIFSILVQNVFISPLTYKLFNLPYNNYIGYLEKHPELNNL